MSYLDTATGTIVSQASGEERASFIRRTYQHLALAIASFGFLEAWLLSLGWGEKAMALLATSRWSWLIVLAAFMVVSIVADKWG